jgi:hypothetical protein
MDPQPPLTGYHAPVPESSVRQPSPDGAARAIRGYSASAECVVLGDTDPDLRATLREVCGGAEIGRADTLAELAARAGGGAGPLVLAGAGVELDLPATLDLLDSPGDRTAALLADPRNIEAPRRQAYGLERATLARVAADGFIESTGASGHTVGNPNRVVIGLLRIRSADRRRAADIWSAAARQAGDVADIADVDLFDLALMALVRAGLPVREQSLGYYRWSRNGAALAGLGTTPWDQRLRSASRLGDGAYSAAVVRRLSRIGTRRALRAPLAPRLTPNLITAISLGVGVAAGLLIFTGRPIAWVVAAVLLQLALIIDCMDGEVARFTRRYSAFGGWLDGIGDRIKEYRSSPPWRPSPYAITTPTAGCWRSSPWSWSPRGIWRTTPTPTGSGRIGRPNRRWWRSAVPTTDRRRATGPRCRIRPVEPLGSRSGRRRSLTCRLPNGIWCCRSCC